MIDLPKEGDQKNLEIAKALLDEATAHMPELSKGLWKPEFADMVQMMMQIVLLRQLKQITAELQLQNHETRMKLNPLSMMNPGVEPDKTET